MKSASDESESGGHFGLRLASVSQGGELPPEAGRRAEQWDMGIAPDMLHNISMSALECRTLAAHKIKCIIL